MVEPSQRWLLNSAPLLQSLRAPQPFIVPQTPSPDPSTTALSRCKAGIAHSIVVLTSDSSQALSSKCQYADLTREHAAAHAHALLARLQPDAEQKATVPDDVFQQALALGKYSCCLLYCNYKWQTLRTCIGGSEGLISWGISASLRLLVCTWKIIDSFTNERMVLWSSCAYKHFQAGKGFQIVALNVPSSAEGSAVYVPGNRLPLRLLWVCQG